MDDLISRQAALDDLVTFILDEVWDEELWELNWRAFPEIICRKMVRLGYVKQTEEGYERLPTIGPVVHCAECRYAEIFFSVRGEPILTCDNNEGLFRDVPEDGYCYCGAKMEE